MNTNPYQSPQHHDAAEPLPPHLRSLWSGIALSFAIAAALVLIFAAMNMAFVPHRDGYEFRPRGPLAKWAFTIAVLGWILTGIAGVLGLTAKDREWGKASTWKSNLCLGIVSLIVVLSAGLPFVLFELLKPS
jgi:hypothetical protein